MERRCIFCVTILRDRFKIKFCSNSCQHLFQQENFIQQWKSGNITGTVGVTSRVLSHHIRKYLFVKYENKCSLCGWSVIHPITKQVPLEIDHIDGNSENSIEKNLRLICPNCHSLTSHFRNLNKGNGRKWRTDKYRKII